MFPRLLFPQPRWILALRHTITTLLDDADKGSLNSWLRCNVLPIFLHSSLLIIHSFILYHFCFTAFMIHLLNYSWYIDVCYFRGRIWSCYGISVNCAVLEQHNVFFFITTLQSLWYFCLCRNKVISASTGIFWDLCLLINCFHHLQ